MKMAYESYPDAHHDDYPKTTFGFWIYLLTDFMFLATIFAAYIVLSQNTFGALAPRDIFSLSFSTIQTLVMLSAAFTAGIGVACAHRKSKKGTITFFFFTFLIGLVFLAMMGHEFSSIFSLGYSWKSNAFLSIYFTLIGMIGLHIVIGLLWILILLIPVFKEGILPTHLKRLTCLRMFWQFVNLVWVLIFTFVYVIGVI